MIEWVARFAHHWKVFLITIVVSISCAYVYLRYTTPLYRVNAKIIINDPAKGQSGIEVSVFSDITAGQSQHAGGVDKEIEILTSGSLNRKVVDSLNYNISYFREGRLKDIELYKRTPVHVRIREFVNTGIIIIDKKDDDKFIVSSIDGNFKYITPPDVYFKSPWGTICLSPDRLSSIEYPITVRIGNPSSVPDISVTPSRSSASVFNISTTTPCPEKGVDFINALIAVYNREAVMEKNMVAVNTTNFIDERLSIISGELNDAERDVDSYKQAHGLTDPTAEAQMFLSTSEDYSKKVSETEMQRNLLLTVKSVLVSSDSESDVIPSNTGLTDPTILYLLGKYNEEVLQKKRMTAGMLPGNPKLKEYNQHIASLRDDLVRGINVSLASMELTIKTLRQQEFIYDARVRALSSQERESRELYRQKEIKESLFVYLLQKREETGLTMMLATPNVKIIDSASSSPRPVSPDSQKVMFGSILLGLILPFLWIYLRSLFDMKVRHKQDVAQLLEIPFLGDIPEAKNSEPFQVNHLRSSIAEKFRIVVANLNFISNNRNKVVLVTSSSSGEGKSFVSRNLALSLATSGKKCLLVDMDIRKSQMSKVVSYNAQKDMVLYLAEPSTRLDEIVDRSGAIHKNLDIILTRIFPPNPAELLASSRLDDFFNEVTSLYDYIIVDTPPVGLVADTFRINQFASCGIFVTRLNNTYKEDLREANRIYRDKRLTKLSYILNGVKYGKQYGYHNKGMYYLDEA